MALLLALPLSPIFARRPSTARRTPAKSKSRLDISKINDPDTGGTIGPHVQGEAVVRAAILLDRLKFSPGEITASYNDNLAKAIAAFQSVSALPAAGGVDAATWAALNNDQAGGHAEAVEPPPGQNAQPNGSQPAQPAQAAPAPPSGGAPQAEGNPPPAIIAYTIAREDVSGPFTSTPKVRGRNAGEELMLREARLPRLNYRSPLELLAEKFHCSPQLLAELNPGKSFERAGEQIEAPNVLASAPGKAASVVVDASTHSVTALDGDGKVLAFYPATVGSEHDPLPVGSWKIIEITRYPKFKYNPNLFWDSEDKHPRATLPSGPRNPVGVVWMGLSKKHYGVHGTPAPSLIGRTQSHGCIRLTNWDASELANMVSVGTPVVLEEGTPSEVKSPSASPQ